MSLTNSPSWAYNPSTGFYSGVATQSLRFDDASSAYLQRTPSSAANRQTFTISCWVKRSNLGLQGIFSARQTKDDTTALVFENSDQLLFTDRPSDARNIDIRTNRLFRDVGAWYHIVVRVDTTQGTSSNRVRLYINGEQETSFATSSYPSQNYNVAYWNNTQSHRIGMFQDNSAYYYDGYIAEFNNVGSSQAPTEFGEYINDIWIPKAYSGSYGTNGFRLEFNGNGNDSSGNGNNFTTFNVSSHDYVPDCPENNFATLNPLDSVNSPTFSEGDLKLVRSSSYGVATGTVAMKTGKWYWEIQCPTVTTSGENESFGISKVTSNVIGNNYLGINTNSWALMLDNATDIYFMHNNSFTDSGVNASNGDIFMFALDADTGKLWFGRNGTWFDSGNPSAGTNQKYTANTDDVYYVAVSMNGNDAFILNFGQDSTFAGNTTAGGNTDANGIGDFKYSVPSGFLALCTANLPVGIDNNEDESVQDYFNAITYTGNGSTNRSITGIGFQPDWVWIKKRNSSADHRIFDSVRGIYNRLASNSTGNEDPSTSSLLSFNNDGFSTGNDSGMNANNDTYVAWNWKAGGSASSNSNGSITSSVSASQEAGFSIVTYTGNGSSGATIGHGLSQAPDLIITKFRQGGSPGSGWLWPVFHKGVGTSGYLRLNDNDGTTSNSETVKAVGSSTYTIGSDGHINQSSGNFVAYVFHEVEGYSKFGSYTGNASSDGTFIYTGFRPSFLIYKRTDNSNGWAMLDTKREPNNVLGDNNLFPDTNGAEAGNSNYYVDFLSNGFKLRTGDDQINSGNYIYIAFADQPFKYANAR